MSAWKQADDLLKDVATRLPDAPERRYVTVGAPAFDCEQLVLALEMFGRGTTEVPRAVRTAAPTTVAADLIRIWKVASDEVIPGTPELRAAGELVGRGAWALWTATIQAVNHHACRPAIDGGFAVGTQGGYAGWRVRLRWTT